MLVLLLAIAFLFVAEVARCRRAERENLRMLHARRRTLAHLLRLRSDRREYRECLEEFMRVEVQRIHHARKREERTWN